jgi:Nucleoside 2-deoxyribosyltransferase/pfkB family carbohydrate kinase
VADPQTSGAITVVGGVYREWCMRPAWREIYGSAGRAASAIATMGAPVELHSYLDPLAREVVESRGALEGFAVRPTPIARSITFDYHHGLETPRIHGQGEVHAALNVSADRIVRFGLMEGDAIVHGDMVVFDPQDAVAPKAFAANGSGARLLALVLNRHEAALLTGLTDAPAEQMAEALIRHGAAHVVVIKQGPMGALVHDGRSALSIPAYRSQSVWKLGSGDNFVAHFGYRWMHEGRSAAESADLASRATAYYCQTRGFPTPAALEEFVPKPVPVSAAYRAGRRPTVYLAAPFFTLAQRWLVEQARADLSGMGLEVFSPYHDVGHGSAADVVMLDLAGIDTADLMFAVGDGMDSGTVYEIGHARAKGKPVVMYCENESVENKKMMQGSGCILRDDYVSAIYETLWTACAL